MVNFKDHKKCYLVYEKCEVMLLFGSVPLKRDMCCGGILQDEGNNLEMVLEGPKCHLGREGGI